VALQSLRDLPSAPRHLILPFMRHYRAVNPIEVFDSYIGVFAPARAAGRKRASNSKCLKVHPSLRRGGRRPYPGDAERTLRDGARTWQTAARRATYAN